MSYQIDKLGSILCSRRCNPCYILNSAQYTPDIINRLNDSILVCFLAQIRGGRNACVEIGLDDHATARCGASSEILGYCHCSFASAFDAGLPLDVSYFAV